MAEAGFYEKIGRLKLYVDKKSNAALLGSRKSHRKGNSAEFSDFREYMPGDDLRTIDWNAYARLDRLYIKEYMEEKESRISLFLDTSASMDYGEKKKSELLKELAGAFCYMGLMHLDHVSFYDMGHPGDHYGAGGGKASFQKAQKWLESREFRGVVNAEETLKKIGPMQPGLTIILSDLLSEEYLEEDPQSLVRLLKYLHYNKQRVILLHILAKEERTVTLSGTCRLIDLEDEGKKVRLTMDAETVRNYEKAILDFTSRIASLCKKYGAVYHLCDTGMKTEEILFKELRDMYE